MSEDGTSIKQNAKYHGKKGNIEKINLINSPDEASTAHYVEVGATAVYYTEGDKIVRMSGKKTDVNLNRFIYIGVNSTYGSLSTKEMRYAISSAIDREAICRTSITIMRYALRAILIPLLSPQNLCKLLKVNQIQK